MDRQRTISGCSPAEAVTLLSEATAPVTVERVPLALAGGRVLAEPILTDRPSPAAAISAMDGFVLRRADLMPGQDIPIAGEVRVGNPPPELKPGACLRIVTGGAIPPGADMVLPREDVQESAAAIRISPNSPVGARSHIRAEGENAPRNSIIADAGTVLTPATIAAIAACGLVTLSVHRRLRLAIITTGDEVVPVTAFPTPWQQRDSNGPALECILALVPWIEQALQRHIADDLSRLADAAAAALSWADALVLTGGVSVGHRDHVPAALRQAGVRVLFHTVKQRPGKPMLGGVSVDGRPVLGLPGNPVSVLVTARRVLIPALAARAGATRPTEVPRRCLNREVDRTLPLWWHRLVRVAPDGTCDVADGQGSADVVAAAGSDGFVELPPHATGAGPWPFYAWNSY